jgi:hypothetical protein
MPERVMVVTGAFATHTTKLYNYYVCPTSFNLEDVEYVAVNYINELKYLGKVINGPFLCHYGEDERFTGTSRFNESIRVDLKEFSCKLNRGDFNLILLEPIIGGCIQQNLKYRNPGAFVESHRYFESLADFFVAHQE